jgi:DNA excision repair protein ERCC-1
VLSSVKGLGATKVTSLVDAFTKPFLIGGLKRDIPRDKDVSTAIPTSVRIDGPGAASTDVVGSPEWPEEGIDEEGFGAREPVGKSRPRDRAPSRAPELGLEKDDEEEEDGHAAMESVERAGSGRDDQPMKKRARTV